MKQIDIILNGTVIDHLQPGLGRKILNLVSTDEDVTILGSNLGSQKLGKKDLLKYSNKILTQKEIDLVSVLAPDSTINVISEGTVKKKIKHILKPEIIEGILKCLNTKCITNFETAPAKFRTSPLLHCFYCERPTW